MNKQIHNQTKANTTQKEKSQSIKKMGFKSILVFNWDAGTNRSLLSDNLKFY